MFIYLINRVRDCHQLGLSVNSRADINVVLNRCSVSCQTSAIISNPPSDFPLTGRPYRGKPSDMWALGVVLFTMLYGQFPFYDSIPQELFRKIKAAEYSIPE